MRIHGIIPYALDKDLAAEYNYHLNRCPQGDWVCFLDHDAMFTTYDWYVILMKIIKQNPEYGVFVCMSNRTGGSRQKIHNISGDDIREHRDLGMWLSSLEVEDFTENKPHDLVGSMILISKKAWKQVGGFRHWQGYKVEKLLGVDSQLHRDCIANEVKVGICKGIYIYHWRSGVDVPTHKGRNKDHLQVKEHKENVIPDKIKWVK